jgi:hypothetical protein
MVLIFISNEASKSGLSPSSGRKPSLLAQSSRVFYLKAEVESRLQNVPSNKNWDDDNVQKIYICINT